MIAQEWCWEIYLAAVIASSSVAMAALKLLAVPACPALGEGFEDRYLVGSLLLALLVGLS